MAVVFISHALEEALTVSDRITVLRDGRIAATGPTSQFDRDRLIRLMVGRSISGAGKNRPARPYGPKILSVANLSVGTIVKVCSFSLYGGQVAGVFGLVGSGRTEMMKAVIGAPQCKAHQGTVNVEGRPVAFGLHARP